MCNRCLTTEEIYQIWIDESNRLKFGGAGKRIKNFDLIKKRPIWSHFEKFNGLVQESNGQIKPELYIKALFSYSGSRLPDIKLLISPKGISLYKGYLKERKLDRLFLKDTHLSKNIFKASKP